MAQWFHRWQKRRALRGYATRLRRRLRELYGPHQTYSPGRVNRAVTDTGVSSSFLPYAYAMYCPPVRFDEGLKSQDIDPAQTATYDELREEIVEMKDGPLLAPGEGVSVDAPGPELDGMGGEVLGGGLDLGVDGPVDGG